MLPKFDYYNKISSSYNTLHGEEQLKKLELIKTELLRNNLLDKGIFVLDIGAGTGLSSLYIDIEAIKVISLEPAFELLKRNTNKYRIQGVAEFLPFKPNKFHIVQSITAIHNFDEVSKAVSEMKRVGKKYFVVSILKKANKSEAIINLLKKEFKVIKEIEEEKDSILFVEK